MNALRWWVAIFFAVFGFLAVDSWISLKWIALTLFLYLLPIACQFFSSRLVHAYGLWIGIFLVLQSFLTPLVFDRDYRSLPRNLEKYIDVQGDTIIGINGLQKITTDEMGFRVTKAVDYSTKSNARYRVFAIGASTTEQGLLDDRRTWTHHLQDRLDRSQRFGQTEVINTGASGLRARHHLATFKRVVDWEPDLVIFMMGINDWNRHIVDTHGKANVDRLGWRAIAFSETLLGRATIGLAVSLKNLPNRSQPELELGDYYSSQNDSLSRPVVKTFFPDRVSDGYRTAVSEIIELCKLRGVPCMFVTQPSAYHESVSDELKRRFWMTPPNTEYTVDLESLGHTASVYNDFLLDSAKDAGIAHCDLAGKMEASTATLYDDCHFNEGGAVRVAEILETCVLAQMTAPDGREVSGTGDRRQR